MRKPTSQGFATLASNAARVLVWSALLAGTGCKDAPTAQQKALLRPVDPEQQRIAAAERERVFDAQGELIPSGEVLAGLEMPKGVKVYRTLEREVYLDAPKIVLEQLERYFAPRLEPLGVSRTLTSLIFENARIKAAPNAARLTVRIARVNARVPASDLMLREEPVAPARSFPSETELQQRLAEMRKYAD